jgi:hypothetical protein
VPGSEADMRIVVLVRSIGEGLLEDKRLGSPPSTHASVISILVILNLYDS